MEDRPSPSSGGAGRCAGGDPVAVRRGMRPQERRARPASSTGEREECRDGGSGEGGRERLPELPREAPGSTGCSHDHEPRDLDAFAGGVWPRVGRRERRGLLCVPAQELLEPADVGFDLACDSEAFDRVMEDDVDPATRRAADGHLGPALPARMGSAQQSLGDRCLVPVAECWTGVGVEAAGEVSAESRGQATVGLERRCSRPGFDPRQVALCDPGGSRQLRLGYACVLTHATNVRAE